MKKCDEDCAFRTGSNVSVCDTKGDAKLCAAEVLEIVSEEPFIFLKFLMFCVLHDYGLRTEIETASLLVRCCNDKN